MASSHDELAVHKALIDHKLSEIHAAGPRDEAWGRGLESRRSVSRGATILPGVPNRAQHSWYRWIHTCRRCSAIGEPLASSVLASAKSRA